MDAEISERLFASYLDKHGFDYQRHFRVFGEKNVDFRIELPAIVLCDVKEVHDSKIEAIVRIDAYSHIRNDLNGLRKKFKSRKPTDPVVLVTMNFSSNYFTGLTVAYAMLGDIGVRCQNSYRGEIHYLPRGNASLTKSTNTSISGVLVFDCAFGSHMYYTNPFAKNRIPSNFFPGIEECELKRNIGENELLALSKLMYWGYSASDKL
jgi:hypothetical protein